MNKKVILVAISVIIIIGIALFFLFSRSTTQQGPINIITFPTASSTTNGGVLTGGAVLSIKGTDGSLYTIPDITQGKKADILPAGTYYHVTTNQDTLGDQAQFELQYGTDNSISIVLLKESLKDSRLAAESYVRSLLKLTDTQLCNLDVTITVPAGVNETFADENLGFSFCPNSVVLP